MGTGSSAAYYTMLEVFVDGKPAPTTAQIEAVFGVKAVADGDTSENERHGLENSYELQGWPLANPSARAWPASYVKLLPKSGEQSYLAEFEMDTQRYCIYPYDFAIYTGLKSAVWPDLDMHAPPTLLPKEYYIAPYQLGMFDWSPRREYLVGTIRLKLNNDLKCISNFKPITTFKTPEHPSANGGID